jgi:two-component system, OmpR family, alkaline phosphatase synthesis response regulator PhoP
MSKVLVVEDDRFLTSAYRAKMVKSGYEVQMAGDGEEAITILQQFHPDIILLDLVMPRKDGFTTLAEIKQQSNLKDIPVIVASNLGQKEDIDKAMALGATDFIIKSDLSMDDLVTKIETIISKTKAT